MNEKQWMVLGIFFVLMGSFFIQLDTRSISCLDLAGETTATEADVVYSVYCLINSKMYDPFIWLFFPLGIVCFILGWLEPKKKH